MARLFRDKPEPDGLACGRSCVGQHVLTSLEAGRANQRVPDEQVLEFARQESRAVLTFNRLHFVRLHKQPAIHHGILVCSEDPNFEALTLRIHRAVRSL